MKDLLQKKQLRANRNKIAKLISSVKVVYADVDGTLVGRDACFFLDSNYNYTLRPAKALISAHKNDLDIVMVSGRNRLQLLEDARLLGTRNYIAELGCQIIYELGKEVVASTGRLLDRNPNKNIFEIIAGSGAVELLFKTFQGHLEYHTPWSEQRECTHLFRGLIDTESANRVLRNNNYAYLKIVDNGVISRRGTLKRLPEIHAYHLLPKECGKSEAVKKDREIRNISKKSTVAIGDALSDLVLAEEVGVFFLVKNAVIDKCEMETKMGQFDNVFITEQEMGLGFAEVVDFVLEAGSAC